MLRELRESLTDFEFDTAVKITDEELDETREAIECTANEIDTEFMYFNLESEPAEYMRDGPFKFQVHGGGIEADPEKEDYRVDLTDAAFIPKEFTLKVNRTMSDGDYDTLDIKGTVSFTFAGAVTEQGVLIGFYCVSNSNLTVSK